MTGTADIRDSRVDAFVADLEAPIRDAIRTRFMQAIGDAARLVERSVRRKGVKLDALLPAAEVTRVVFRRGSDDGRS